ncbi:hypothetical protein D9M71_706250 [compost metagenome]
MAIVPAKLKAADAAVVSPMDAEQAHVAVAYEAGLLKHIALRLEVLEARVILVDVQVDAPTVFVGDARKMPTHNNAKPFAFALPFILVTPVFHVHAASCTWRAVTFFGEPR